MYRLRQVKREGRVKRPLPTVTPERLRELMEEGRKLRKAIQKRLAPLLNVSHEKMNRRFR